MSLDFDQSTRLGKLHTVLGENALVLVRFGGEDKLNGLFDYRVEALSTSSTVDFDALLGTHATVEIDTIRHGPRFFDGIVTQARWVGPGQNGYQYELILRPWVWLASKRRQQRIFHDKSAPEILEDVLGAYASAGKMTSKLKNSYDPLEYTVQYGESDLTFVTRLMERFGISYHFEFKMSEHEMILTDTVDELPEIPGGSRKYLGNDTRLHGEDEHFWNWKPERNIVTGAVRLTDYNFKTPDVKMDVDREGDASHAEGLKEAYDFPGDYLEPGKGKTVAALRLAQERGGDLRYRAIGDALSLGSGMRITLDGQHEENLVGKTFVCLSAQHFFESDAYGSGSGSGSGTSYSGSYSLTLDSAPVAPPRQTPKPLISGPQTAVVVGDGEIDCDEFGRVLVHFHWDLAKAYSMRVRSSNAWAHKGYGEMTIPRIGMEVIVEFLNGDPDLPIITGSVYNGRNMPPYPLPANKTRTTIKTKTHGGAGFNELRFEDDSGKEEIFLHAQMDRTEKVLQHSTTRIDANEVRSVGKNRFTETVLNEEKWVGGNLSVTVSGTHAETYATGGMNGNWEGIRSLGASLDQASGGPGTYSLTAALDVVVTAGQHSTYVTGANRSETVGANSTLTIATNSMETVGANKADTVGGNSVITVGGNQSITVGKALVIQAGDSIILQTGSASITMKKDGSITIKGKDIAITASGKIIQKASSDIVMKGSKINQN